jgi:ATP-dependent DNA helicase RecG
MAKMGLIRPIDLALHLPLRYEDETRLTPLAACRPGDTVHVDGRVVEARIEPRPRRQLVVNFVEQPVEPADDAVPSAPPSAPAGRTAAHGESLVLRFLNFYASHQKALVPGACLRVRGELRQGFFGREIVHPAFRVVEPGAALAATLTPVYPVGAGLPQAYVRKAIDSALGRAPLDDLVPARWLPPGLPSLREALRTLHRPPPGADLAGLQDRSHPAWQRLKFEELLAQQLAQSVSRRERARRSAPVLALRPGGLQEALRARLPFGLTGAQQRVVADIAADLSGASTSAPASAPASAADRFAPTDLKPMNRLLQGDVGAGKTVVAALAAAQAIDAGWQCALMAPTELLAEQHFRKLVQWLEPLGVVVAWLTGSRKGKARQRMRELVASGEAGLVVGTQAVIQDDVQFARLGLAIVDEQHRFGVQQRLMLRRKLAVAPAPASGVASPQPALEPHLLMMTATPIPRTLAMSYYADLDVSTIDELPPGRTPIVTKLFADHRRADVIQRLRDEVRHGRQVYWVCPLIEESEAVDLQNATETHALLSSVLAGAEGSAGVGAQVGAHVGAHVGLLHGRMPAAEKAAVMALFSQGRLQVLVATTVIEVGVDVPNASVMVIEHAERFGLAQLHQLRGRVGRGAVASTCVLLYSPPLSQSGKARLQALAQTNDGFDIAERDLQIRGPGEFMGERQSGDALLRFADLAQDSGLLALARRVAPAWLAADPAAAHAHIDRWLAARLDLLDA